MENLNLKGGALIIGSLFWQNDLDTQSKDGIRKDWRAKSLKKTLFKVKLPIRYGRLSQGGIYTMVFSKECEVNNQFGLGYIKPLRNDSLNTWDEIEKEVIEMSHAEGLKGRFIVLQDR